MCLSVITHVLCLFDSQIIESMEERNFDEDGLDKMVELVVQVLPPHPNQQNMDDEAAEDDGEQNADMEDGEQEADVDNAEEMDAS